MTATAPIVAESLSGFAATANNEYGLVRQSGEAMVLHATRCGDALLAAREQVPHGEWVPWMKANLVLSPTTAYKYMRLARHAAKVPQDETTVDGALVAISEQPWHNRNRLSTEQKQAMTRLASEDGLTLEEIAELFGISVSTAWYWASEKNRKHRGSQRRRTRAEQRLAAAARSRELQAKSVKKMRGPESEAYSLVRRAVQMLDRAQAETSTRDAGIALRRAIGHLHSSEDEIARALGIQHGVKA